MGEAIIVGFAGLAVLAIALLAIGLSRRRRRVTELGAALLLALVGAWLFGPIGLGLGGLLLGWLWIRKFDQTS